jgi:hypothetical protein
MRQPPPPSLEDRQAQAAKLFAQAPPKAASAKPLPAPTPKVPWEQSFAEREEAARLAGLHQAQEMAVKLMAEHQAKQAAGGASNGHQQPPPAVNNAVQAKTTTATATTTTTPISTSINNVATPAKNMAEQQTHQGAALGGGVNPIPKQQDRQQQAAAMFAQSLKQCSGGAALPDTSTPKFPSPQQHHQADEPRHQAQDMAQAKQIPAQEPPILPTPTARTPSQQASDALGAAINNVVATRTAANPTTVPGATSDPAAPNIPPQMATPEGLGGFRSGPVGAGMPIMPKPQSGQMPVMHGGFPGGPAAAGAGPSSGGPGAAGPGVFPPGGGGPAGMMPKPQNGETMPGAFPGGPGAFTAGGGLPTMPKPQGGQMPGGFPGGPGPAAGAGPASTSPGDFTAGGGPSTLPKPQGGQMPVMPAGFPGGAGPGSSGPGAFTGPAAMMPPLQNGQMMPPLQNGQMMPGGFPGRPGPVAGNGPVSSVPGAFTAGGGASTMPKSQSGQMPMVPGGFPGPIAGTGPGSSAPGATGPGAFAAGGGASTMPKSQSGQMPMIPGGFPGPTAGTGPGSSGPGATGPGAFTAGGGASTMPKPQSGQMPTIPGGFPGGSGAGSQVSRPGGFPGGSGFGAMAPQSGGLPPPASGGFAKPPTDAGIANAAALPNRGGESFQAAIPWSANEGPETPSSYGLPASPSANRDKYTNAAPPEGNGNQAMTPASGNSVYPNRSFQPIGGSDINSGGSFGDVPPSADRISQPKMADSYMGSTSEASTTRFAQGSFSPGSRSNQEAESQGASTSNDDKAVRQHPAERYEEDFDWIEKGTAWFGVQENVDKAIFAVVGTAAALTIGYSSKMQQQMPLPPPTIVPVVQESAQIQSTALPTPLPPPQQVQAPKPIIQSKPQPPPMVINPIKNEPIVDASAVEVPKEAKLPPRSAVAKLDRPATVAPGKEPQSAVSEERLEAFMERLQARYDDLGLKLTKKELTLQDESIQQLAQAQAQKAIAEEALTAMKDAKSRLAAEKGRLDMAMDEAKLLYARLGEQSMIQLLNVQKQLKKAEESLQAAAETRAAFDASIAKPAAEKSMDLEDVQRVYSERESQVRSSMALLEEDSEKQVARVQAQLEAAKQSLDSVLGEKARLEVQQAELNTYVGNVDERYAQLIRQAELRLQVDEANLKVAERVLRAVTEPGSYKLE